MGGDGSCSGNSLEVLMTFFCWLRVGVVRLRACMKWLYESLRFLMMKKGWCLPVEGVVYVC